MAWTDIWMKIFPTIKTAIGYTSKSAWKKISYVNSSKLTQITIYIYIYIYNNFGQVVPPFDINLSNTLSTQNYLLTLHRL